jgi:hypothetical protein
MGCGLMGRLREAAVSVVAKFSGFEISLQQSLIKIARCGQEKRR